MRPDHSLRIVQAEFDNSARYDFRVSTMHAAMHALGDDAPDTETRHKVYRFLEYGPPEWDMEITESGVTVSQAIRIDLFDRTAEVTVLYDVFSVQSTKFIIANTLAQMVNTVAIEYTTFMIRNVPDDDT